MLYGLHENGLSYTLTEDKQQDKNKSIKWRPEFDSWRNIIISSTLQSGRPWVGPSFLSNASKAAAKWRSSVADTQNEWLLPVPYTSSRWSDYVHGQLQDPCLKRKMLATSSLSLPGSSFSWLTSYEDKGNDFRMNEAQTGQCHVVSTWSLDKGPGFYFCIQSMHDYYRINRQTWQNAKNYDVTSHWLLKL
jgi:hypothetical protein